MYERRTVLPDTLTTSTKSVSLPRGAVIDAIMLRASITLANGGSSAITPTYGQALSCITEIKVMSDNSTVHYSLSGNDLALLNYLDHQGCTPNPDDSADCGEIAASGSGTVHVLLMLDRGDILAFAKNNLTLSIETTTATGVADLTMSGLSIEVVVDEAVYSGVAELESVYGKDMALAAEPKLTVLEQSFSTMSELQKVLELPSGDVLLNRGMAIIEDSSGDRSNSVADKVSVQLLSPEKREFYTVPFAQAQELNRAELTLPSMPAGVLLMDYGAITGDGLGFKGWRFNKGDMAVALKTSAAGTLRYISHEHVVQPHVVDSIGRAVLEA